MREDDDNKYNDACFTHTLDDGIWSVAMEVNEYKILFLLLFFVILWFANKYHIPYFGWSPSVNVKVIVHNVRCISKELLWVNFMCMLPIPKLLCILLKMEFLISFWEIVEKECTAKLSEVFNYVTWLFQFLY